MINSSLRRFQLSEATMLSANTTTFNCLGINTIF
jgi:hypothetical protein